MHIDNSEFQLPPILPLVVIEDHSWIDPLVTAFTKAGVGAVEIGLRTPYAYDAISAFAETGNFEVGAGTVTSAEQIDAVRDRGATFGLSPWGDPFVVDYADSLSWPFIPGAATPTEVRQLVEAGCQMVKIFPVKQLGGVGFLQALRAVFPDVSFLPTGGISELDASDYLSLGNVPTISGSWMTPTSAMRDGLWGDITARLKKSVEEGRG
jgi:2-dehydro-3-deoxyphosphogluconate aldolase / (4S)-4-hydroxy-2-oxoglutarate aldolase